MDMLLYELLISEVWYKASNLELSLMHASILVVSKSESDPITSIIYMQFMFAAQTVCKYSNSCWV